MLTILSRLASLIGETTLDCEQRETVVKTLALVAQSLLRIPEPWYVDVLAPSYSLSHLKSVSSSFVHLSWFNSSSPWMAQQIT